MRFRWYGKWERFVKGGVTPGERDGVNAAAIYFQGEVKKTLNLTQSIRGPGGRWAGTPSRPGSPPAKFQGSLGRSIQTKIAKPGTRKPVATVYAGTAYARIHEMGGRTGRGRRTVMPARPFMRPTMGRSRKRITAIIAAHIRRASRR